MTTRSPSDPTPTTDAGRRLLAIWENDESHRDAILAIEAQARAEAWNEGNGLGFREGHRKGRADALREAAERDFTADVADALHQFPVPTSMEEWQNAVDRSYESDAEAIIAFLRLRNIVLAILTETER